MAPHLLWREELTSPAFRRELLSECVGTFALLFLTLGCVVFTSDGGLTPAHSVRLALNNGSTVAVLAYALGDISALLNPAVTLAFCLTRGLSKKIDEKRQMILLNVTTQCGTHWDHLESF